VKKRGIGITTRPLFGAATGARCIESRDLAEGVSYELMVHTIGVAPDAGHRPKLIESQETTGTPSALIGASACPGNIKDFQLAVQVAHEVVMDKVGIFVASSNDAKGIQVTRSRPIAPVQVASCARSWAIPRGDFAVRGTQESMDNVARVNVVAGHLSFEVDGNRIDSCLTWHTKCLAGTVSPIAGPS